MGKIDADIIQFVRDPQLIGGHLSEWQETALRLLYGLPLNDQQRAIARKALDVETPPETQFREGTFICGRRGGKSDKLEGNIAVYEATVGGHERHLGQGERGHIVLIAQDRKAARVLYGYILAKLENSPILSQLIQDIRREEIDLKNRMTISIFTCTLRSTRGYSIPVALLDEVAFYRAEGVNVDKEVIDAIRPAQATFPRSKLIKVSSPYAKQGELYRDFATRNERPDLLCFQAASWDMNPSIPKDFLESERERDPEHFDREYGAIFSDNITNAFGREQVEACVVPDRYELPPCPEFRYLAACDPAGGGRDEFALSIMHREGSKIVQDLVRGWRSKRPGDIVDEAVALLRAYRISSVLGDRYSGEWVRSAFRDRGIRYQVADRTASDALLELIPLINQSSIELLDDRVQTRQLIALERRTSRTRKDTLGHPPGGHDDRAAALAHGARLLSSARGPIVLAWGAQVDRRRGYKWTGNPNVDRILIEEKLKDGSVRRTRLRNSSPHVELKN